MRVAIPWCIAALLFLAMFRILVGTQQASSGSRPDSVAELLTGRQQLRSTAACVLLSQLVLPLLVYAVMTMAGLPLLWCLAATLVAAAPPISGSPNLVQLLGGDSALTLRWLMLGTAVLPLSCLPVLYLLFPAQSATMVLQPALTLLLLIGGSVLMAALVFLSTRPQVHRVNVQCLDGASSLMLALMVIGLMSGLHDPSTGWTDVIEMILLAFVINAGYQLLGMLGSRMLKQNRFRTISSGVTFGNRNIALYLSALPAAQLEPLLLFIACYQVPMYLTPLIGDLFYRRLE